jgi:hypothetical protein
MKNVSEVIQEYYVKVLGSPSSIFSREDVIDLLGKLSVSLRDVPRETSDVQTRIEERIFEVVSDIDIESNVELELNGYEITCTYYTDTLVRSLKDMVREEFESQE